MSQPFLGQIVAFGGNFAPRGWVFCAGQLLQISQNGPLYSLLGTTYGGDGETTFGVPDLRGRAIVGAGQGPGLSSYNVGQQGGAENVTLTPAQLPMHTHMAYGQATRGTTTSPAGNMLAIAFTTGISPEPVEAYASAGAAPVAMGGMIGSTGYGSPVPTRPPSTCLNYIMAVQGDFPTRA